MELNAATRLLADWWSDLSPEEQEKYIKDHPHSDKAMEKRKHAYHNPEVEISDSRYSNGSKIVRVKSETGYKTKGHDVAEELKGRWSNREKGYIMSPTKALKFQKMMAQQ
jgi:hypothetical protein